MFHFIKLNGLYHTYNENTTANGRVLYIVSFVMWEVKATVNINQFFSIGILFISLERNKVTTIIRVF